MNNIPAENEAPPPLRPSAIAPPEWLELASTVKLLDRESSRMLVVTPVNYNETQLELSGIGQLNDPAITLYGDVARRPGQVAARLWQQPHAAVTALLRAAPFWLDAIPRGNLLAKPDSFDGYLARCRLAEIGLAALDPAAVGYDSPHWEPARALLLRQQFRYLAALSGWEDLPKRMPDYEQRMRAARAAWAGYLLERRDVVEQAFWLVDPSPGSAWDIEAELRFLVFPRPGHELQPIAMTTATDRQVTDAIVRRGFLGRNNVHDAAAVLAGTLAAGGGTGARIAPAVPRFYAWFIGWTAVAALLFALGSAPASSRWVGTAAVVAGAAAAVALPVGLWAWVWARPGLARLSLYPLALRVPALALLGLSVVAGISGYLPYAFNAWDSPYVATAVSLASLGVTFGYILFETLARVEDRRVAARRALWLTAYLAAATFWLALLVGLFADPVGMTLCVDQGPGDGCSADGRLFLARYVYLFRTRVSVDFVFFVGALSLMVGLLTQLFWEEKSVAEPL